MVSEIVLRLESKDEVKMLIENLESEKERLEEMLMFPEHYKDDLPRAKWDLEHVNRVLEELRKLSGIEKKG